MGKIEVLLVMIFIMANFLEVGTSSAAYIVESDPANGAKNVPVGKEVIIRFNTSMDKVSVETNLEIHPDVGAYGYILVWSNNDKDLTIQLVEELEHSRDYTITLTGVVDSNGDPLEDPTILFETEEENGLSSASVIVFAIIFLVITIIMFIMGFQLGGKKGKSG
jgi:hypothetical protein